MKLYLTCDTLLLPLFTHNQTHPSLSIARFTLLCLLYLLSLLLLSLSFKIRPFPRTLLHSSATEQHFSILQHISAPQPLAVCWLRQPTTQSASNHNQQPNQPPTTHVRPHPRPRPLGSSPHATPPPTPRPGATPHNPIIIPPDLSVIIVIDRESTPATTPRPELVDLRSAARSPSIVDLRSTTSSRKRVRGGDGGGRRKRRCVSAPPALERVGDRRGAGVPAAAVADAQVTAEEEARVRRRWARWEDAEAARETVREMRDLGWEEGDSDMEDDDDDDGDGESSLEGDGEEEVSPAERGRRRVARRLRWKVRAWRRGLGEPEDGGMPETPGSCLEGWA